MGELLSQSECDAILLPVTGRSKPRSLDSDEVAPSVDYPNSEWKRISFLDPEPVSELVVDLLMAVHAQLCVGLEARFRSLIGTEVRFAPVSLITERFDAFNSGEAGLLFFEFGRSLESFPCRIAWRPAVAMRFIELLLGGSAGATLPSCLSLTAIERRLLLKLCEAVLDVCCESSLWNNLDRSVLKPDTSGSQSLRGISNVTCFCIGIDVTLLGQQGELLCWLPVDSFTSTESCQFNTGSSELLLSAGRNGVGSAKLVMKAELASFHVHASDLVSLAVGDVLMTDVSRFDEVCLNVGNRRLFHGGVGTLDGRKSVRLSSGFSRSTRSS
jgi:flagellar motor switch protein FliM